jgi:GT2 family glycosyltransferase
MTLAVEGAPTTIPGLVSTIVPVYNRPAMAREAIESVLGQSYRPVEVIACDDGSTDDSLAAVEALARGHPDEILVLRLPHRGPGPTRESGRRRARGEFIQYLDSDDLLRPTKFAAQVRALQDQPACGVAYGPVTLRAEGAPPSNEPFKWTGRRLSTLFPALLVDRWWTTESPLYRRRLCDAIGPWSDLRWSQDWEYDARIGALGTRLAYCDELLAEHRHHHGVRQTSPADWTTPERLRERKRFMGMLFRHAQAAGVTPADPEMQHFSRWIFHLSRQCAAAGLGPEAAECLSWAVEAAGPGPSQVQLRLWRMAVAVLGPSTAGGLARQWERLSPAAGSATMKQSWMQDTPRPSSAESD